MQIRIIHFALLAMLVLGPSQLRSQQAGPIQTPAQLVQEVVNSAPRTIDAASVGGEPNDAATPPPAEHQLVAWAIERFAMVGIDLPDVEVTFHDHPEACNWNEGIYSGANGVHRAQICIPDRGTVASDLHRSRTLIHELAHAWEQAVLDDTDRQRLLLVLDAEAWVGSDLAWEDRGAERFAETIVWGLYDQLRRPTRIDASCAELHADFQGITGHAALGPLELACALE